MVKISTKLGAFEVDHAHMWKDRTPSILFERTPLLKSSTRVATIGSCFAAEIASAMDRLRLHGAMHPGGFFYTTQSIRQEMQRIFSGDARMSDEPPWRVKAGYVHPFQVYNRAFPSPEALREWSADIDRRAVELFKQADLYVITLGLIETWESPHTGLGYRQIPHPEVFTELRSPMRRLGVAQMIGDLTEIHKQIRSHTAAPIIFTVSPVPLHSTFTRHDVRVANNESKCRIRAAVSEFIEQHADVHYFHSYEIVSTAERLSDFMEADGRHVHRHAVDYILNEFLRMYACDDVAIPEIDLSWLAAPSKTAERFVPQDEFGTSLRRAASTVWRGLPVSLRQRLRESVRSMRGNNPPG